MKRQSIAFPLTLAIGLHIALGALIFFNTDVFHKNKDLSRGSVPQKTQFVETVSVDSKKVKDLVKKLKKRKAAKIKKQKRLERRLAQLERNRKAAEKKSRAAINKRKKEEKKAKDAAKKRKQQEKLTKEASEKLTKEKQLADAARQKREKEELDRQIQQEMDEQMKQKQQKLAKAREQKILTEKEKYVSLIRDRIYKNLVQGVDATVTINLAPGGLLIDVSCVEGDVVACKAAVIAVKKSEPFPVSKDPQVFAKLRKIRLKINKLKPEGEQ